MSTMSEESTTEQADIKSSPLTTLGNLHFDLPGEIQPPRHSRGVNEYRDSRSDLSSFGPSQRGYGSTGSCSSRILSTQLHLEATWLLSSVKLGCHPSLQVGGNTDIDQRVFDSIFFHQPTKADMLSENL